jgi:hypothetical protein
MPFNIRKNFFYQLFKNNKFCFSNNFLQENMPKITNFIEKQAKLALKNPVSTELVLLIKSEFRKIKYSYSKIKGGYQKKRFLIDIENQLIEIGSEFFESNINCGKVNFFSNLKRTGNIFELGI